MGSGVEGLIEWIVLAQDEKRTNLNIKKGGGSKPVARVICEKNIINKEGRLGN